MSAVNYIPQYENLSRLQEVVGKLQGEINEGNKSKNNILNLVDEIIGILNKENPDYNSAIKYIDDFLQRYKTNSEEFRDSLQGNVIHEPISDILEQEKELTHQNARLRQILEEKKKINKEYQEVNQEYEQGIDNLIELVQNKKYEDQSEQLEYVTDIRAKIEKERADEWELYEKVLKNDDMIYKLNRSMLELYKILDVDDKRRIQ